MNPLEIPELLLHIFNFGSDSDIDDGSLGLPPSTPYGYSHPRSPKPFFRSIIRVRKNWKRIVESVPSFWLTKVSLRWYSVEEMEMGLVRTGLSILSQREQCAAAEELLNDSNGSDIDFSASVDLNDFSNFLDDFGQWMNTHIFSASDRVRQLRFYTYPPHELFKMVLERSFSRSWPRLRTLNLEIGVDQFEVSQTFNAPQLSFASFKNLSWIEDQLGLASTSLSSLHIEHDPEFPEDQGDYFRQCTVMTYLSPSLLSSLTELKLTLWDRQQDHVLSVHPPSVSFQRLERMSLTFITVENIWQFLKHVNAPRLTVLYILPSARDRESDIPNEVFAQRFPLLEDMRCSCMTPLWASVFLRLLPTRHDRLSTLSLRLDNITGMVPQASDPANVRMRKEFFPHWQPMELPNLRNLSIKQGTIDPWFFTNFNLETTTGHLFLDDKTYWVEARPEPTQPGPFVFPNVTKMTVRRRKDLTSVVTPALRHLILQFPADYDYEEGSDSVSDRLEDGRTPYVTDDPLVPCGSGIPLGSLESLEVDSIWLINLKLFGPFNSIHTLVIFTDQLLTCDDPPVDPRHLEIIAEARTSIESEPVLPNLHTLGLSFKYREMSDPNSSLLRNNYFEAGLCIARAFMSRRLGEGNPVRTFRIIGFLPKALESGSDFTWIRDVSGAKIEFARRKHDFAPRLRMKPC